MMIPISEKIPEYFSENRIANLSAFFAITIGIYIAVISILATSIIGLSAKLLEAQLDKSLIFVTKIACWENIFAVLFGTFLPVKQLPWSICYVGLLIVSIVSFIKFLRIMFLIFQGNMEKMAKEIDQDTQNRNDILIRLDNIENDVKEMKNIKDREYKQ